MHFRPSQMTTHVGCRKLAMAIAVHMVFFVLLSRIVQADDASTATAAGAVAVGGLGRRLASVTLSPAIPTCSAHFGDGESYVSLPPFSGSVGNPVSYEFWFKLGQRQAQYTRVFDFSNGWLVKNLRLYFFHFSGSPNYMILTSDDGGPTAHTYVNADLATSYPNGPGAIVLNRWYHAVTTISDVGALRFYLTDGVTGEHFVVLDGTTGSRFFVDGVPRNYTYIGRQAPADPNVYAEGRGFFSPSNMHLSGFRVWPVALLASEVQTLATGGSIGSQPSVYLPFDDSPGSGMARDASGNGRNGTIFGSLVSGIVTGCPPVRLTPAVPTCSAYFGGGSYMSIPPLTFGMPVSFELWLNFGQVQPEWTRIFTFSAGSLTSEDVKMHIALGRGSASLYNNELNLNELNFGNTDSYTNQNVQWDLRSYGSQFGFVVPNRWYHVVTTISATGDLQFYMTDGESGVHVHIVEAGDVVNDGTPWTKPNAQISRVSRAFNYLGRSAPGDVLNSLTNVRLSGFRVWNVTLSASEVQTLATGGNIGRQPLVHLPFDDLSGSRTARDASGNGLHAALVGDAVSTGGGNSCAPYAALPSPSPTPRPENRTLEIFNVVQRPVSGSIGLRGEAGGTVFQHNGVWKLFVAGGYNTWTSYYKDIVLFDLSTNTWTSTGQNHNIDTGNGGANIACAWDRASAVYCAGGSTTPVSGDPPPSVNGFKYSYGSNTVTALPSLPLARRGACAVFYAGRFWILGGYTGIYPSGREVGSLISLNVSASGAQWEEEMPETASTACYVPLCTLAGGKLYFHCGMGADTLIEIDLSPTVARPRSARSLAQFGWNDRGFILGSCLGIIFAYQYKSTDLAFPAQAFSYNPATNQLASVNVRGVNGTAPTVQLFCSVFGDDDNCRIYAGTGWKRGFEGDRYSYSTGTVAVNDVYEIQLRASPTPSPTPTPSPSPTPSRIPSPSPTPSPLPAPSPSSLPMPSPSSSPIASPSVGPYRQARRMCLKSVPADVTSAAAMCGAPGVPSL